jgi:hypothetical protein
MTYDSYTENGVPYIKSLYMQSYKYSVIVDDLDALAPLRKEVRSGGGAVSSYQIGNRNISRGSLSAQDVLKQWDKLMGEKERIESGRKPRKAVGVVHRDW